MTKGWAHSGDVLLTHNVPMGYSFLPLARPRDFRHYRLLGWLGLSIQDLQPLGVPEPITRDCALFSLPAISLRQKPKHSCVIALQDGVRAKNLGLPCYPGLSREQVSSPSRSPAESSGCWPKQAGLSSSLVSRERQPYVRAAICEPQIDDLHLGERRQEQKNT